LRKKRTLFGRLQRKTETKDFKSSKRSKENKRRKLVKKKQKSISDSFYTTSFSFTYKKLSKKQFP
jgi:hypothetical protein